MAAKRTADLIPLCHPLALTSVDGRSRAAMPTRAAVDITATCRLQGPHRRRDGGADRRRVAALTVYDMCKAVDRGMGITDVRLLHKSGGKSGTYEAPR